MIPWFSGSSSSNSSNNNQQQQQRQQQQAAEASAATTASSTSVTKTPTKLIESENNGNNGNNTTDVMPASSSSATSIAYNNNNSKFLSDCVIPARVEYLLDMPPCSFATQIQHSWNPDDRSLNIFVKELDPLTLHRHPVAQSTDCIRTKRAYERGIHLWELTWNPRQRGTHAIIGMSEGRTQLHCVGYQSLIGWGSLNKLKVLIKIV